MRDEQPTVYPAPDPFGWTVASVGPPPRTPQSGEVREVLIAELRALIAEGRYQVEPEAVADAIIEESIGPPIIHWLD